MTVPASVEREQRRLCTSITVRFDGDEAEALRACARRLGQTYSAVVRAALRRYTDPTQESR